MRQVPMTIALTGLLALASCASQGSGPVALTLDRDCVSAILANAGNAEANGGRTVFKLTVPAQDTYFLNMRATVPAQLGAETVRYTMSLDGKPVLAPQGWDKGYVPYFTVDRDGQAATLRYLFPLKLSAGEHALEVQQLPHSRIETAEFSRGIAGVDAKAVIGGEGHVFFPDEKPEATIAFTGPANAQLKGRVLFQSLRLADSWGQSDWSADVRVAEAARLGQRDVNLALSADGKGELKLPIPCERYGLVGITACLEDGDKRWSKYLCAAAIVPRRDLATPCPDGIFISTFYLGRDDKLMAAYKRIGIDWVRIEFGWDGFEHEKGKFDWSRLDPFHDSCRKNGMLVMNLASHAPEWAKPKGDFVDIPYKNYKIKLDNCPGREFMGDWENAWRVYFERYKDVNRATNLWNEPWEGMGISGWKSTGEHYRLLLKGLKRARDAADPTIKIVAADSAHNTDWKIFAADMQDHIDVISTHYESPRSGMGFAMARFYKKELWETETWMSWQGDGASLRRCLYNLALGASKVSLWTKEMLFDADGDPTPATAWTAATRHMLRGTTFNKVVHPERPPFVLLFSGKDRQVAAVVSTLADDIENVSGHFRSQFALDTCTMELDDPAGKCKVFDLLANEIACERKGGKLLVPVDREVRYIESSGPAEEFERNLGRAVYGGLRPVEIVLRDVTAPLGSKSDLLVTLRNAHPFVLSGTVEVRADGLTLEQAQRQFELPAATAEQVAFKVVAARPSGANVYPTTVTVKTDVGSATLSEPVSVAVIARGTPKVDGDISEWQGLGAVPILMAKGGASSLETARAWFPWQKFVAGSAEFAAEMAFAADDKNLYVMARVKDKTPKMLPSILAGKELSTFQNPPGDYVYREIGPWPDKDGDGIQLSLGPIKKDWVQKYEVFQPDAPLYRMGSYLSTLYHYVIYPTEGGGAEILRTRTPNFYYLHPLPMNYAWLAKNCRVDGASVVVKRLDEGYVYEAAIPWTELAGVPHSPGDKIRMGFLVRDNTVYNNLQWSQGRSIASHVTMDFDPSWVVKWSSETEWGFVGNTQ